MKMLKCNRRRLAGALIVSILLGHLAIVPANRVFGEEAGDVTGVESSTEDILTPTPGMAEEISPTPEGMGEGELSPTPENPDEETKAPTEEAEPTKELTSEPEITEEAEPTEELTPEPEITGEGELSPTPENPDEETKAPTEEAEPTKELTPEPEITEEAEPTEELTPEPEITGEGELSPTPENPDEETKIPTEEAEPTEEITPTPEITEEAEPTEAPEVTEEITPSPTPTIKPSLQLPTESNDARYQYLFGTDVIELTIDNPPPGYETEEEAAKHMKTITVPVWKINTEGKRYSSTFKLTINEKLAKNVKAIFKEIYALDIKFPIRVLKGYGYRKVGGVGLSNSTLMSMHSFGAAIDINPWDYDNDYYLGKGNDLRNKDNPYCIPDEVIEIFERYGWFWGGNFEICADTMHFQYLGLEYLTYQDNSPFRDLKVKKSYMKGTDVRNLQQRLCELGYKVSIDGVYGSKTASAIKKYQKKNGLKVTGVVDYKTWETIINETHYMPYAF